MAETTDCEPRKASRSELAAWCLFDWANSAFPTVVLTFVFAAYFTNAVAADPQTGTGQWGLTLSLSALAVALLAPLLGAIADQGGSRKPWLAVFSLVCIAASAGLWWIESDPAYVVAAMVLVFVGNTAFEQATVFYNAMLPGLVPEGMIGRLSGWAWACGYAGGLAALGFSLLFFALPEAPLFGLDKERYEHVRVVGPFIALWYLLFSVPLWYLVRDARGPAVPLGQAMAAGLRGLIDTLRQIRRYRAIARFLLARLFYIDGLNTLFAFGGVYAAGSFGMDFQEILVFGIVLNVTAGLGAAAFSWIDDWLGSRHTILIAVAALTLLGAAILLVEQKLWFYVLGALIGVFVGPAQSASRSLMARLAPPALSTEMFGLFAFSGKATAFAGPALVGWVTVAAGSQRAGMATILLFFVIGFALLLGLREVD